MTIQELTVAINFGYEILKEAKERNEEVPTFVYDRIIELQGKLISKLMEK